MATLRWATCFPSKREPNSHISLAQATNGPSHAFSHAMTVPLTEEQGSRRNMSSLSGFLSSRPSDLVLKAHGMRNEMYYILSEMALDRSSLHPWFLHRSGTSTISPASKRCDQDGLCSRFTLHSLLAVISLRIPWENDHQKGTHPNCILKQSARIATTKNSAASRHRVPRLLNEPRRREH